MLWRFKHSLRILWAGSLVAAAAASLGVTQAAAEEIKVGALRFTSHAASFVAFERGYFEEQGLDVEFIFFQAAQPMAVAIASKDVDFGVTAITGGLINLARGSMARRSWSRRRRSSALEGRSRRLWSS